MFSLSMAAALGELPCGSIILIKKIKNKKERNVMTQLGKRPQILLAGRFLVGISGLGLIQVGMTESNNHNENSFLVLKVIVLVHVFPEEILRKDMNTSSLFGSGKVGKCGREEEKGMQPTKGP